MTRSALSPFANPAEFFHARTRSLKVSATYTMGGDAEVSSATPYGANNSLPSTRFGFDVVIGFSRGVPKARVGLRLNTVWPATGQVAIAQINKTLVFMKMECRSGLGTTTPFY